MTAMIVVLDVWKRSRINENEKLSYVTCVVVCMIAAAILYKIFCEQETVSYSLYSMYDLINFS